MGDRYRIQPPKGSAEVLTFEAGTTTEEAFAVIAGQLGLDVQTKPFSLLLRNHPAAALPFTHIMPSDQLMARAAPPGSVLVVEVQAEGIECSDQAASVSSTPGGEVAPLAPKLTAKERPLEERGLTGLRNLGNTCYMNSAVQCLSQVRTVRDPLEAALTVPAGPVADAFAHVLQGVWGAWNSEAVVPKLLKDVMAERSSIFVGTAQQDAQELLQALLEALHQDMRRDVAQSPCGASVHLDHCSEDQAAMLMWEHAQASDASPISDLFQGQLRSVLRCGECGQTEVTFELFWSLPLPIPDTTKGARCSIEDALDAFCAEEELEDSSWSCPQCQRVVRCIKRFQLWRLPRVLQLHLKRFQWRKPGSAPPASGGLGAKLGGAASGLKLGQAESATSSGVASTSTTGSGGGGGGFDPTSSMASGRRSPRILTPTTGILETTEFEQSTLPFTGALSMSTIPEMPSREASKASFGSVASSLEASRASFTSVGKQTSRGSLASAKPEEAWRSAVASLPWEQQEKMFALVLRLLDRIAEMPSDVKLRSIKKSAEKLQNDVLELSGGVQLLQWAGFQDVGERFEAATLSGPEAKDRSAELRAQAYTLQMRHLRRVRDEKIEQERLRRLPHADDRPVRRWGGRLRRFGRGQSAFGHGLECTKIDNTVALCREPERRRGFAALLLDRWLAPGAPGVAAAPSASAPSGPLWPSGQRSVAYEVASVVQHFGQTPFSGHYVATCWHEPSGGWCRFDDSHVQRLPSGPGLENDVFTSGSYVVFLECVQ